MNRVWDRKWRSFARHWPWFALPGVLLGCAAPTSPPKPPSGGTLLHLGDCHGGGIRGTLQLSPATAIDTAYDFAQISLQVTSNFPDQSPILTRPLADSAGGTAHAVKVFADTNDTQWRTIRAWVRAGVTP